MRVVAEWIGMIFVFTLLWVLLSTPLPQKTVYAACAWLDRVASQQEGV